MWRHTALPVGRAIAWTGRRADQVLTAAGVLTLSAMRWLKRRGLLPLARVLLFLWLHNGVPLVRILVWALMKSGRALVAVGAVSGFAARWLWRHAAIPFGHALIWTWHHTAVPAGRAVAWTWVSAGRVIAAIGHLGRLALRWLWKHPAVWLWRRLVVPFGHAVAWAWRRTAIPFSHALTWIWRHTAVPFGHALGWIWRHTAVPVGWAVASTWTALVVRPIRLARRSLLAPANTWLRETVLTQVATVTRDVLVGFGLRRSARSTRRDHRANAGQP